MRCRRCKQLITHVQLKQARIDKDEKGRMVAAYHRRCGFLDAKAKEGAGSHKGGRYAEDAPTPYDMASGKGVKRRDDLEGRDAEVASSVVDAADVLAERQKEIEEQKALEPRPEAWTDWRDPITTEI